MTTNWLTTPLGRRCLANEQRLVRGALDRVFGDQTLQLGCWSAPDAFLRFARTQRHALVGWQCGAAGVDLVTDVEDLAIADDSVDAVLLPHTLELTRSPQALLRETSRILRADGHVVVLAFDPASLWGLRGLGRRDGYPPGHKLLREGRLRDWLELLSFDVGSPTRYCHTLPLERVHRVGTLPRERWARRWLPMLAGAYMVTAQKRVRPVTPIRPAWSRPRLRAVGGLVEPTRLEPTRRASRPRESA